MFYSRLKKEREAKRRPDLASLAEAASMSLSGAAMAIATSGPSSRSMSKASRASSARLSSRPGSRIGRDASPLIVVPSATTSVKSNDPSMVNRPSSTLKATDSLNRHSRQSPLSSAPTSSPMNSPQDRSVYIKPSTPPSVHLHAKSNSSSALSNKPPTGRQMRPSSAPVKGDVEGAPAASKNTTKRARDFLAEPANDPHPVEVVDRASPPASARNGRWSARTQRPNSARNYGTGAAPVYHHPVYGSLPTKAVPRTSAEAKAKLAAPSPRPAYSVPRPSTAPPMRIDSMGPVPSTARSYGSGGAGESSENTPLSDPSSARHAPTPSSLGLRRPFSAVTDNKGNRLNSARSVRPSTARSVASRASTGTTVSGKTAMWRSAVVATEVWLSEQLSLATIGGKQSPAIQEAARVSVAVQGLNRVAAEDPLYGSVLSRIMTILEPALKALPASGSASAGQLATFDDLLERHARATAKAAQATAEVEEYGAEMDRMARELRVAKEALAKKEAEAQMLGARLEDMEKEATSRDVQSPPTSPASALRKRRGSDWVIAEENQILRDQVKMLQSELSGAEKDRRNLFSSLRQRSQELLTKYSAPGGDESNE